MKLLAVADVHGRYDKVTRHLERVADEIDILIVAGDITGRGTASELRAALQQWQPLAAVLWAVAGNMDSPAVDAELERLELSLNGRCRRHNDLVGFGCSAAPVAIGTPYEVPEAELRRRITQAYRQAAAEAAGRRVFVPHAPPHGALDRVYTGVHAGSHAVREFIDRHAPDLVICGHIHEARGQTTLGRSLIINCGPATEGHAVLIDLQSSSPRVTWLGS